ncbi:MAG: CBS domain-containing protein, partial [Erysipelotrichaceae bacterium]|nr:CBS domain-containing protein [Erysipelotrichaceae bacterium]
MKKDINILALLTPKKELAYLDDSMSVRQALEKMRARGFSAIPLIHDVTGEYLGSVSEGDLLWTIVGNNIF